jgi:hypothetical protein
MNVDFSTYMPEPTFEGKSYEQIYSQSSRKQSERDFLNSYFIGSQNTPDFSPEYGDYLLRLANYNYVNPARIWTLIFINFVHDSDMPKETAITIVQMANQHEYKDQFRYDLGVRNPFKILSRLIIEYQQDIKKLRRSAASFVSSSENYSNVYSDSSYKEPRNRLLSNLEETLNRNLFENVYKFLSMNSITRQKKEKEFFKD